MNTRHSQRDPLILVVDEGKSMRMLLCTVMEQEGYRVIEAGSAEQCLAFFRFHPDVILLNAMMPGVDGLMCCVRLQKLSGNHPPVLIITSLNDQATIDRIFEVGATDYITKPIRLVVSPAPAGAAAPSGQPGDGGVTTANGAGTFIEGNCPEDSPVSRLG